MQQQSDVYSFQSTKDGKVFIFWKGKTVMTLKGSRASAFLAAVDEASEELAQLEMARITGNFKRGNERLMGQRKGAR
ncbi:hypothetical protein KKG90_12950 [Candidatus Bipolaricaulota bacterium]|nr:hypothetical protein [Candidatus Bipolaricaulota bacterium]